MLARRRKSESENADGEVARGKRARLGHRSNLRRLNRRSGRRGIEERLTSRQRLRLRPQSCDSRTIRTSRPPMIKLVLSVPTSISVPPPRSAKSWVVPPDRKGRPNCKIRRACDHYVAFRRQPFAERIAKVTVQIECPRAAGRYIRVAQEIDACGIVSLAVPLDSIVASPVPLTARLIGCVPAIV